MPKLLIALLTVAVLLFTSSVAQARRIALVVGNSEYDKIASLRNPERDAGAIADRLRLIGFEVTEAFNTNLTALMVGERLGSGSETSDCPSRQADGAVLEEGAVPSEPPCGRTVRGTDRHCRARILSGLLEV